MKIRVLSSGSKGNCTYVELGTTKILIDIGISFLQVKKYLEQMGVSIYQIDIILITHSHKDHINGLNTVLKNIPNILTVTTNEVYMDLTSNFNYRFNNFLEASQMDNHLGFSIHSIKTSHDVPSCGFVIGDEINELVYITDTGYLNRKYFNDLRNKTVYIFESNYDDKMLMEGPYPFILKQRILSDKGHLSNNASAKILSEIVGHKTKYIFLAHISEHNNTKEIALDTAKKYLENTEFNLNNIIVTEQGISLDVVEV